MLATKPAAPRTPDADAAPALAAHLVAATTEMMWACTLATARVAVVSAAGGLELWSRLLRARPEPSHRAACDPAAHAAAASPASVAAAPASGREAALASAAADPAAGPFASYRSAGGHAAAQVIVAGDVAPAP